MAKHSSVTICGTSVPVRDFDGTQYVAMRPLVLALGLAWKPQFLALKHRFPERLRLMPFLCEDGKYRRLAGLPRTLVSEWAFSINLNKIKRASTVERLRKYRAELDEEARAQSEAVMVEARVMRLGEEYRDLPLAAIERHLISQLRREGRAVDGMAAYLGYRFIARQAKAQLDLRREAMALLDNELLE